MIKDSIMLICPLPAFYTAALPMDSWSPGYRRRHVAVWNCPDHRLFIVFRDALLLQQLCVLLSALLVYRTTKLFLFDDLRYFVQMSCWISFWFNRKGIQFLKTTPLLCWWSYYDWSFAVWSSHCYHSQSSSLLQQNPAWFRVLVPANPGTQLDLETGA